MAKYNTIADIRKSLNGGGARPNLFEVDFPENSLFKFTGSDSQLDSRVLVKAAQLPASNIASIDVPFRGRIMKVAGDRTFDTWTVTVINDVDFNLRTAFQTGCRLLHNMLMDLVKQIHRYTSQLRLSLN